MSATSCLFAPALAPPRTVFHRSALAAHVAGLILGMVMETRCRNVATPVIMPYTMWTKPAPHAAAISEEATDLMAIMVLLVEVARRPALPRHHIASPADRLNTRARRQ